MKRSFWIVAAVGGTALVAVTGFFCARGVAEPADAPLDMQKVSYAIGYNVGRTMKMQELGLNVEDLVTGLREGLAGTRPKFAEEELMETLQTFQQKIMTRQTERIQKMSEENRTKGEAFLAETAKRAGVKVLPSGLQYEVIREGTGPQPKATDKVTVNYRGTLIDGTEFDSSYKRGQPATFPVNGVIAGWTEALSLMKTGAKWKLYIPSTLAYGDRGAGQLIGPNATLVFEVELIGIQ